MKAQLYGTGTLAIKRVAPAVFRVTKNLTPSWNGSFGSLLHFDQGRVEGRSAAEVGEPRRGEHVDVDAAFRQLCPAKFRSDHSGRHGPVHSRSQHDLAAVVEHPYPVAVLDASALGVSPAHFEFVLLLHLLQAGQIDKRRVQEVVR